jgi:hypothetical protein
MLLMRDYWRNLIMRGTILSAVLFAATLGGCYTTGSVGYRSGYYARGGGDVYVSTPDLVAVSPGVQVVVDYDEPVFYSDGFYWRYYNDGWYRSNNYATGWYYYERPPVAVLRIDRPYAYARYRPQGYVARSRGRYRPADPIVRDHRQPAYRSEPAVRERRDPGYRPDPVVRDHRDPGYRPDPVVRDHRDPGYRPDPADRGHREHREPADRPAPADRGHREAGPARVPPTPAPAPETRDHRTPPPARDDHRTRDHRR